MSVPPVANSATREAGGRVGGSGAVESVANSTLYLSRYHKKSKHRKEWKKWQQLNGVFAVYDDVLLNAKPGLVSLFKLPVKKPFQEYDFPLEAVTCCALTVDGIAVCDSKHVYVWERDAAKHMYVHGEKTRTITAIALSADSHSLVYGTADGCIIRVDVKTGNVQYAKKDEPGPIRSVACSSVHTVAFSSVHFSTETFDMHELQPVAQFLINDCVLLMTRDENVYLIRTNHPDKTIRLHKGGGAPAAARKAGGGATTTPAAAVYMNAETSELVYLFPNGDLLINVAN
jgi:hypothetical protein